MPPNSDVAYAAPFRRALRFTCAFLRHCPPRASPRHRPMQGRSEPAGHQHQRHASGDAGRCDMQTRARGRRNCLQTNQSDRTLALPPLCRTVQAHNNLLASNHRTHANEKVLVRTADRELGPLLRQCVETEPAGQMRGTMLRANSIVVKCVNGMVLDEECVRHYLLRFAAAAKAPTYTWWTCMPPPIIGCRYIIILIVP